MPYIYEPAEGIIAIIVEASFHAAVILGYLYDLLCKKTLYSDIIKIPPFNTYKQIEEILIYLLPECFLNELIMGHNTSNAFIQEVLSNTPQDYNNDGNPKAQMFWLKKHYDIKKIGLIEDMKVKYADEIFKYNDVIAIQVSPNMNGFLISREKRQSIINYTLPEMPEAEWRNRLLRINLVEAINTKVGSIKGKFKECIEKELHSHAKHIKTSTSKDIESELKQLWDELVNTFK